MSKRLLQFIASLFVIIGGVMIYEVFSGPPKMPVSTYWIFGVISGLFGILTFAWVARRK